MAKQEKSGNGAQRVGDFMTTNPSCVSERDSIADAARIMKDSDTGVVPVVDGKKIVGLVTDRDIVVRGIAGGKDMAAMKVADVMTREVRSVSEDTPVAEVLELMSGAQVRRIPVVNQSQEIVGIVSLGDIATASRETDNHLGKAIEEISKGPANN
jgi:CBS domain-containing protein